MSAALSLLSKLTVLAWKADGTMIHAYEGSTNNLSLRARPGLRRNNRIPGAGTALGFGQTLRSGQSGRCRPGAASLPGVNRRRWHAFCAEPARNGDLKKNQTGGRRTGSGSSESNLYSSLGGYGCYGRLKP